MTATSAMTPLFPLGQVVITVNAADTLESGDVADALRRHSGGDWDELDPHGVRENRLALLEGSRVLSAYTDRHGTAFWIISEANRALTCILLPKEYLNYSPLGNGLQRLFQQEKHMPQQPRNYSFLFGWLVVRASAFHRLNLFDVYVSLFRHAFHQGIELCPVDHLGQTASFKARNRYATAHQDRHGTAFWIISEGDLSRVIVRLANE